MEPGARGAAVADEIERYTPAPLEANAQRDQQVCLFDPILQKDFYKFYGIMISSRPGVVNVDSPALQGKNRPALLAL